MFAAGYSCIVCAIMMAFALWIFGCFVYDGSPIGVMQVLGLEHAAEIRQPPSFRPPPEPDSNMCSLIYGCFESDTTNVICCGFILVVHICSTDQFYDPTKWHIQNCLCGIQSFGSELTGALHFETNTLIRVRHVALPSNTIDKPVSGALCCCLEITNSSLQVTSAAPRIRGSTYNCSTRDFSFRSQRYFGAHHSVQQQLMYASGVGQFSSSYLFHVPLQTASHHADDNLFRGVVGTQYHLFVLESKSIVMYSYGLSNEDFWLTVMTVLMDFEAQINVIFQFGRYQFLIYDDQVTRCSFCISYVLDGASDSAVLTPHVQIATIDRRTICFLVLEPPLTLHARFLNTGLVCSFWCRRPFQLVRDLRHWLSFTRSSANCKGICGNSFVYQAVELANNGSFSSTNEAAYGSFQMVPGSRISFAIGQPLGFWHESLLLFRKYLKVSLISFGQFVHSDSPPSYSMRLNSRRSAHLVLLGRYSCCQRDSCDQCRHIQLWTASTVRATKRLPYGSASTSSASSVKMPPAFVGRTILRARLSLHACLYMQYSVLLPCLFNRTTWILEQDYLCHRGLHLRCCSTTSALIAKNVVALPRPISCLGYWHKFGDGQLYQISALYLHSITTWPLSSVHVCPCSFPDTIDYALAPKRTGSDFIIPSDDRSRGSICILDLSNSFLNQFTDYNTAWSLQCRLCEDSLCCGIDSREWVHLLVLSDNTSWSTSLDKARPVQYQLRAEMVNGRITWRSALFGAVFILLVRDGDVLHKWSLWMLRSSVRWLLTLLSVWCSFVHACLLADQIFWLIAVCGIRVVFVRWSSHHFLQIQHSSTSLHYTESSLARWTLENVAITFWFGLIWLKLVQILSLLLWFSFDVRGARSVAPRYSTSQLHCTQTRWIHCLHHCSVLVDYYHVHLIEILTPPHTYLSFGLALTDLVFVPCQMQFQPDPFTSLAKHVPTCVIVTLVQMQGVNCCWSLVLHLSSTLCWPRFDGNAVWSSRPSWYLWQQREFAQTYCCVFEPLFLSAMHTPWNMPPSWLVHLIVSLSRSGFWGLPASGWVAKMFPALTVGDISICGAKTLWECVPSSEPSRLLPKRAAIIIAVRLLHTLVRQTRAVLPIECGISVQPHLVPPCMTTALLIKLLSLMGILLLICFWIDHTNAVRSRLAILRLLVRNFVPNVLLSTTRFLSRAIEECNTPPFRRSLLSSTRNVTNVFGTPFSFEVKSPLLREQIVHIIAGIQVNGLIWISLDYLQVQSHVTVKRNPMQVSILTQRELLCASWCSNEREIVTARSYLLQREFSASCHEGTLACPWFVVVTSVCMLEITALTILQLRYFSAYLLMLIGHIMIFFHGMRTFDVDVAVYDDEFHGSRVRWHHMFRLSDNATLVDFLVDRNIQLPITYPCLIFSLVLLDAFTQHLMETCDLNDVFISFLWARVGCHVTVCRHLVWLWFSLISRRQLLQRELATSYHSIRWMTKSCNIPRSILRYSVVQTYCGQWQNVEYQALTCQPFGDVEKHSSWYCVVGFWNGFMDTFERRSVGVFRSCCIAPWWLYLLRRSHSMIIIVLPHWIKQVPTIQFLRPSRIQREHYTVEMTLWQTSLICIRDFLFELGCALFSFGACCIRLDGHRYIYLLTFGWTCWDPTLFPAVIAFWRHASSSSWPSVSDTLTLCHSESTLLLGFCLRFSILCNNSPIGALDGTLVSVKFTIVCFRYIHMMVALIIAALRSVYYLNHSFQWCRVVRLNVYGIFKHINEQCQKVTLYIEMLKNISFPATQPPSRGQNANLYTSHCIPATHSYIVHPSWCDLSKISRDILKSSRGSVRRHRDWMLQWFAGITTSSSSRFFADLRSSTSTFIGIFMRSAVLSALFRQSIIHS